MGSSNCFGQDTADVDDFDLVALGLVLALGHRVGDGDTLDLTLVDSLQCRPGEDAVGDDRVHFFSTSFNQLISCFCQSS